MTLTNLDISPFSSIVTGIGYLYWIILFTALFLALKMAKTWLGKSVATILVLVIMVLPMLNRVWDGYKDQQILAPSLALFDQHCKTAGEQIDKTVENVDTVVWMKWRNEMNISDQFKLDDPYGWDCWHEECVRHLLHLYQGKELLFQHEPWRKVEPDDPSGYHFVETIDPRDGKAYRYHLAYRVIRPRTQEELNACNKNTGEVCDSQIYDIALDREPISQITARYGITWEDLSTREDREHWVAGGALKIYDLQTNELIAKRTGFIIDKTQGAKNLGNGGAIWEFAHRPEWQCPKISIEKTRQNFIYQVLKAKRSY